MRTFFSKILSSDRVSEAKILRKPTAFTIVSWCNYALRLLDGLQLFNDSISGLAE